MTAAYLDKQPHLLDKWSGLNPLGRIGRPDELRGVIAWLASDASTFCTGSECVDLFPCFFVNLIGFLKQHTGERRTPRVVNKQVNKV